MKPGLAKRTLLYCGKVLLASVGAFVVLTLFYAFYENSPYSLICEDGVTNEKYRPYVPYCRMTEGLSYGRTNNDGYIDLRDYEEGMPIDVLVMGSSQMEALEVPQQYCTASQLDALLPEDVVYNIGISGHFLPICASNLKSAMQKYSPRKYVIIETGSIQFSQKELSDYIQDTGTSSKAIPDWHKSRLYVWLKSNPFIHFTVNRLNQILDKDETENTEDQELADLSLLSQTLGKMSETVRSSRGG